MAMTLPHLDGYNTHDALREQTLRMQQELICTDGFVDKTELEQHPYFQQLVTALQRHNLSDVLLKPAIPNNRAGSIPEQKQNDSSCGLCDVLRGDMCHKESLCKGASNRLSKILEEVEGDSPEALDHALADINDWLDKEFDFSTCSGPSTPTASAAVTAQDLCPNEWEELLNLHRKAHETLGMCRTSAERQAMDETLTSQLMQVRAAVLEEAEHKANAQHDPASSSSSTKKRRQLPAASLAVLKRWLFTHRDNPYPSEAEKRHLAREANLDITQVRNWYANVRNRKRNLLRPRKGQR